jgi:hypothetical protein
LLGFVCYFTKVKMLWTPKTFGFLNFLCCYMCDSPLFSFIILLPLATGYVTSVSLCAWQRPLLQQSPLDDSIAAKHLALFVFVSFTLCNQTQVANSFALHTLSQSTSQPVLMIFKVSIITLCSNRCVSVITHLCNSFGLVCKAQYVIFVIVAAAYGMTNDWTRVLTISSSVHCTDP